MNDLAEDIRVFIRDLHDLFDGTLYFGQYGDDLVAAIERRVSEGLKDILLEHGHQP